MYQDFTILHRNADQSRNLNVISNNMVNVQTSGYKRDTMVTSTFQEEMLYRTGRHNKANPRLFRHTR
ncbi:flagellar basal body protein [Enterocloster sp.]|uniref:flagellar basal body protein n=1 Tax=Enterocloster sp. TaxID=2719315 RepID=UPI00399F68C9